MKVVWETIVGWVEKAVSWGEKDIVYICVDQESDSMMFYRSRNIIVNCIMH